MRPPVPWIGLGRAQIARVEGSRMGRLCPLHPVWSKNSSLTNQWIIARCIVCSASNFRKGDNTYRIDKKSSPASNFTHSFNFPHSDPVVDSAGHDCLLKRSCHMTYRLFCFLVALRSLLLYAPLPIWPKKNWAKSYRSRCLVNAWLPVGVLIRLPRFFGFSL